MKVTIYARRITTALAVMVVFLTLANAVSQLYSFSLGPGFFLEFMSLLDPSEDGKITLLNFGSESNIATWYSSSALLLCSILLATIALIEKRSGGGDVARWGGLSVIFLFISADEEIQVHERASEYLRERFDTGGFLLYPWVILAAGFLFVFVLAYLSFLVRLPARTRWLFVVAGGIFVGGALGLEMVEALYDSYYGTRDGLAYATVASSEEVLEMVGVVVLVYALMSHIGTHLKGSYICVGDD